MKLPFDVKTYYDHTRFDYATVWNGGKTLALHVGYYDENARRHHDALNNMNRVLADLAQVRPGEKVLDAGCGMGGSTIWLAEHRGAHATGLSIVPSQIQDCRKNAAKKRVQHANFVLGDFLNMPFADATFDVVWSIEALCHAEQKADYYREAHRVLKPGGRLVVAEMPRTARPLAPQDEQLLRDWLDGWAIPDLDTPDEHRAHAMAAGFTRFAIQNVNAQVMVSLRNMNELCRKWLWFGNIGHRLGLISDIRMANVRSSMLPYPIVQKNLSFYALMRGEKD